MTIDINRDTEGLDIYLEELVKNFGGDIEFYQPITEAKLSEAEQILNYRLPDIFRWFYTQKTNGIRIDNKSILPIYDERNKKTFVENIVRFNDPSKELYFKRRSHIYNDYIIVGYDHKSLICISKKYDFPNPLLYVCPNPNAAKEVDFYRTEFNLEYYIKNLIQETYGEEVFNDWILK